MLTHLKICSSTKKFFDKSFRWQKINVLRLWKKKLCWALLSLQKWENVFFFQKVVPNFFSISDQYIKKLKLFVFKTMLYSQLLNFFFKTEKIFKLRIQQCFSNVLIRNEKKIGGYFLKKTYFPIFGGLKVPNANFFFHSLKTFIFCHLKLFSKIFFLAFSDFSLFAPFLCLTRGFRKGITLVPFFENVPVPFFENDRCEDFRLDLFKK